MCLWQRLGGRGPLWDDVMVAAWRWCNVRLFTWHFGLRVIKRLTAEVSSAALKITWRQRSLNASRSKQHPPLIHMYLQTLVIYIYIYLFIYLHYIVYLCEFIYIFLKLYCISHIVFLVFFSKILTKNTFLLHCFCCFIASQQTETLIPTEMGKNTSKCILIQNTKYPSNKCINTKYWCQKM